MIRYSLLNKYVSLVLLAYLQRHSILCTPQHKMLPGAKRQGNGAIQNTASLALRERKEPNHVIAGVPANTESRDDFEDCEYEESDAERWNEIAEKTDVVSRILFPLTFLVFNICYWIGYTL